MGSQNQNGKNNIDAQMTMSLTNSLRSDVVPYILTFENRQTSEPRTPYVQRVPYSPATRAGVPMTADRAMQISTVWRCIAYLSQSIAKLPWRVRRGDDVNSVILPRHPVDWLINSRASDEWSAFQFRETLMSWALRHGNGYAEIERTIDGRPYALHPIEPQRVVVMRDTDTGELYYLVSGNGDNPPVVLDQMDMFHVRGYGESPVGVNFIHYAAESLGWAKAVQTFGANFFGNGAQLAGVVTMKKPLSMEALNMIRKDFNKLYGGSRTNSVAFLDNEMQYQSVGTEPEKGQFIETNEFLVDEICFVPGTEILTSNGVKHIEDIVVGDYVLTHKNRWKPVLNTMCHRHCGEVFTIQGKCLPSVTATGNHNFFIQPVKPSRTHSIEPTGECIWKPAADLVPYSLNASGNKSRNAYDCLTAPRLITTDGTTSIDLKDWFPKGVCTDNTIKTSDNVRANETNRIILLGYELGWLIGSFIGDGSTTHRQVAYYFGAHKSEVINKCSQYLANVFNINCSVNLKGSVSKTLISNEVLAKFFGQFGHVAHEKHFTHWVMTSTNKDFRNGLLDGLLETDGCNYKDDLMVRSTSNHVIEQLRIFLWADALPNWVEYSPPGEWGIEGRFGNARETWTVRWRKNSKRRGVTGVSEHNVYFDLKKKESSNYDGLVYNLEVEEDNSYFTAGGLVHNCRWFGVPPHKVYELRRSTFSNIEHMSLEVVEDSLKPWAQRFIDEANFKLFGQNRGNLYTWMDFKKIIQIDTKTRLEYATGLRNIGVLNANEIRDEHDYNAIPVELGGDKYVMQSGMTTLEHIGEAPEPAPVPEPVSDPVESDPPNEEQVTTEDVKNLAAIYKVLNGSPFQWTQQ